MKRGEKWFLAVWGLLVAALISILPAVCNAAEVSTCTPSYAYQNEEASVLIFGSGFPNPHVAATLEGGAVTQLTRVSDSMLVAKIVSAETGFHTLTVYANGLPVVSPGEIEIRPKPSPPEVILREAKERIHQIAREFFCFMLEETRRTTMAMNVVPSKKAARALYDAHLHKSLLHDIELARLWQGIADRATADIQSAGGGPELVDELMSFSSAESDLLEAGMSCLFGYASMASDEFQNAPPLLLVQKKLPYEAWFRMGAPGGSPLSTTFVELPPAFDVGTANTTVSGDMRLRFDPSPNPEIALVTVLIASFTGTPLAVGDMNFGPLAFAQDAGTPSTGTLNLRTGEIVLAGRYLATSPLLQALGLAPLEMSFSSVGVIYPISHVLLDIITKGNPGPNAHTTDLTGFLLYGGGVVPDVLPVIGGQPFLAVGYGCSNKLPYAPRPGFDWKLGDAIEDEATHVWDVEFPTSRLDPVLTITPAAGTTVTIASIAFMSVPKLTPPKIGGGLRVGATTNPGEETRFGGIVQFDHDPAGCTRAVLYVELIVKAEGFKDLRCGTSLRIHF